MPPDRGDMACSDLTPEKLDEYRARGGRIRRCPTRAVMGAGYIVDRWRGSFYPVRQGPGELALEGPKRRKRPRR